MNRSPSVRSFVVAACAGFLYQATVWPAAAEGAPVSLAAHHAVYRLSLLTSKGANVPAAASGAIDYDFTGSGCDGYTTNFRQLVELQPQEGDSKLNDTRTNTFENEAATDYTFNTKVSADDADADTVAGKAQRGSDGRIGVDLKTPAGHADFAAGVLFPSQHLRQIIAAAEHGDKLLSADVYDGSESGKKLFRTLTVIGAPITGATDDAAGKVDALNAMRRWPVVISYFGGDKDQPDYVLSSDLYENGISRALKLDYGDFVLAGTLDQLTVPRRHPARRVRIPPRRALRSPGPVLAGGIPEIFSERRSFREPSAPRELSMGRHDGVGLEPRVGSENQEERLVADEIIHHAEQEGGIGRRGAEIARTEAGQGHEALGTIRLARYIC